MKKKRRRVKYTEIFGFCPNLPEYTRTVKQITPHQYGVPKN